MMLEQAKSVGAREEVRHYLSDAEAGTPAMMAFSDIVLLARAEQQYRELVPFPRGNHLTFEIVRMATRVEIISARIDERTDSVRGYANALDRASRLRDNLVQALELEYPQEGHTRALNDLEGFRSHLLLPKITDRFF